MSIAWWGDRRGGHALAFRPDRGVARGAGWLVFPFWKPVLAPVLAAAEVRRVVEIGALRGDNTREIIETLGPDSVLHVIDPVPEFDPDEHRARFGAQYVFHRDLSLAVLGTLPPMDAALVDGDHNWYTVVNELRLLGQVAREHGAPLPVLILHLSLIHI